MGIQDQDDYWEKKNPRDTLATKKTSGLRYLSFFILFLLALLYAADYSLKLKSLPPVPAPEISNTPTDTNKLSPIHITADRQGHFRGTLLINNIPTPFLIDTGATMTVIPEKFAITAKLPIGVGVYTHTAGGKVLAHKTHINHFQLGNIAIKHLPAQINPHLNEVLVGMNTLKLFNFSVSNNVLTLSANSNKITVPIPRQILTQNVKPPEKIKPKKSSVIIKRIVCDNQKNCRTVYSDY